jgi:hypothetical protein
MILVSRRLALGMAMSMGLTGPVLAQPAPPPYAPVPPLREEGPPPPPPGPRYVWEPGHWHWMHGGYVWIGGRYVVRDRHWHDYVPGEWVRRGPGWVWVPAHWR